ncbi:hypothetical protein [Kushneria phosphatilytica]|uniref:hypothetical protein n=1 Tax=Kushneria phosphatilytica TaxID=657387 RepID=UPI0008DA4B08|nr:hypothetical protein [Kushneria phosphatilytica]OHV12133.1 hypothetical protein BH688_05630 [Kushneria phosphatilytica]
MPSEEIDVPSEEIDVPSEEIDVPSEEIGSAPGFIEARLDPTDTIRERIDPTVHDAEIALHFIVGDELAALPAQVFA